MAGNYPDQPSWRMAYDKDGTQAFGRNNAGALIPMTSTDLTRLNDETHSAIVTAINGGEAGALVANSGDSGALIFIFPEHRDLDAFLFANRDPGGSTGSSPSMVVQVSSNTTNGIDGDWVTVQSYGNDAVPGGQNQTKPGYRTAIVSTTALGVKAVRFASAGGTGLGRVLIAYTVHLYGEVIPGDNPQRLMLWHPTLDQHVPPNHFDWGDVPRGSSAEKTFRVKNMHPSLSAQSIRVAMDVLSDASPSVPAQHVFSTDGEVWLPQVNIGTLGPGAISPPIRFRRVTPSNAALGLATFRVFADPQNWT